MPIEKYGWAVQKSLFAETNQDSTFSYTRENSKMFYITSKYFSFFNNKPPASWVAHITRDFLTCYSCSYYSSMVYPSGHSFFLHRNSKFYCCTQTVIRFFYCEIQNFTVVPKQPFVFLQRITKYYSCPQTAIRSLTTKYEIFKVVPKL